MTRYRKRNNFQNTFKDYLVPIVWGALLLLVIFSIFNRDSTSVESTEIWNSENRIPVDIIFNSVNTQAFVSYPSWTKEEISDSQNLYKGETIIVKEGTLQLALPNGTNIALNKIAEFKYNEDGSFSLYSSDAWIDLNAASSISMKYATISAANWSVLSLTQNEAWSTVYVLAWSAKVTNLGGISTSLTKWQKLSVWRQYAASTEIDLSSEKWNIDSYFKGSDWFIDNKWFEVLDKVDPTQDSDEDVQWGWDSGAYLSFDSLRDEMSTSKSSLNISGKILNESVESISVNNSQAKINSEDQSFALSNVSLWSSINDLVVKVYWNDKSILEKKVMTVYSSAWSTNTATNSVQTTPVVSSWGATFPIDATDFGFTSPSVTGKFVATGPEVTIRWVTTAENISRVEVNGFKLASFNGSTWRYHAFERFETLEEWTNRYKVDYFWADGSLIYTDYYTIVKKPATDTVTTQNTEAEVEIISDEAPVQ